MYFLIFPPCPCCPCSCFSSGQTDGRTDSPSVGWSSLFGFASFWQGKMAGARNEPQTGWPLLMKSNYFCSKTLN